VFYKSSKKMPSHTGGKLELLAERRVGKGWVYLRYRT
jgi:hypothetical protein